ncbi:polysaccharide deacetylase family protein [Actinomadura madurae]|uniref:polysaccharide deacetylase family protein n=1 Tax=Actinomadura madurae TaxID=1993 RepID=UPI0020D201F2|nr:polysaccharide deacetylase family protein [Actinomadura madurae]MCQ0021151.1 polysaccharide deacetylase family protein [Actinomadura madurae]
MGKDGEAAPQLDDLDTMCDVVRAQAQRYEVVTEPRWPDGTRIAVNFTADFDAMLLRRLLDEPPMQLAKGEFGGRVGVWRLLDLFDGHAVKTTLFVPGRISELYPDAVRAWARSGHEIADHMWEHRVPAEPSVERAHLLRSTEALEKLAGAAGPSVPAAGTHPGCSRNWATCTTRTTPQTTGPTSPLTPTAPGW